MGFSDFQEERLLPSVMWLLIEPSGGPGPLQGQLRRWRGDALPSAVEGPNGHLYRDSGFTQWPQAVARQYFSLLSKTDWDQSSHQLAITHDRVGGLTYE